MGSLISTAGPVGLLSLVVVLILTGYLVPHTILRDVKNDRDRWRDAARLSEEARHSDREQVRELLEVARVADHVLTALPTPGEVGHGTAGVDETAAR
jgi:hypothetical protein